MPQYIRTTIKIRENKINFFTIYYILLEAYVAYDLYHKYFSNQN
jgi:hypothetical protein